MGGMPWCNHCKRTLSSLYCFYRRGSFFLKQQEKLFEQMISGKLAYISVHLHIEQHYRRLHSICYHVPSPHPHTAEMVNHQTLNE